MDLRRNMAESSQDIMSLSAVNSGSTLSETYGEDQWLGEQGEAPDTHTEDILLEM